MSGEAKIKRELAEHLRRIEEAIASEPKSGDCLYRLSLLTQEHARIRRHLHRLEKVA